MEEPVTASKKPDHLICGSGWALILAIACSYFAYRTYSLIAASDYDWQHNWWHSLTWAVWVVLAAGVVSEVSCRRERILVGVILLQCVAGLLLSLWNAAPYEIVRYARWGSLTLWCVGALLAVVALLNRRTNKSQVIA